MSNGSRPLLMSNGSRPLQIWKGPKTYTRWDRKIGWIWACWICNEEREPCNSMPVAYSQAIDHLMVEHLGEEEK